MEVTYVGLGGGGVGATLSRAGAEDVLRYEATESGGGRVARGTIVLPRRERMIIGVDDTDSKTQGATWTLVHNIAQKVDRKEARYISHSLVQLFPDSRTSLAFAALARAVVQEPLTMRPKGSLQFFWKRLLEFGGK